MPTRQAIDQVDVLIWNEWIKKSKKMLHSMTIQYYLHIYIHTLYIYNMMYMYVYIYMLYVYVYISIVGNTYNMVGD
jgi:hypothetical protein